MNNKNQNKRRQNKKSRPKRGRVKKNTNDYRLAVNNRGQISEPDSEIVDLPWTDITKTFDPGSVLFGSFRYKINDPFDPNPLSPAGDESAYKYSAYATLYRRYRVLSARIQMTIVNQEAFPVFVTAAPADADIASSVTDSEAVLDIGEMPYAMPTKLLAAVGGMDRMTHTQVINIGKFIGNKQTAMADVTYGALVTTNPSTSVYYAVGITAESNFVNGVARLFKISFRVLWTNRNFDIPAGLTLKLMEDRKLARMKELIKSENLEAEDEVAHARLRSLSAPKRKIQ
jgi:hypothetical protein